MSGPRSVGLAEAEKPPGTTVVKRDVEPLGVETDASKSRRARPPKGSTSWRSRLFADSKSSSHRRQKMFQLEER